MEILFWFVVGVIRQGLVSVVTDIIVDRLCRQINACGDSW